MCFIRSDPTLRLIYLTSSASEDSPLRGSVSREQSQARVNQYLGASAVKSGSIIFSVLVLYPI